MMQWNHLVFARSLWKTYNPPYHLAAVAEKIFSQSLPLLPPHPDA